MAEIIDDINNIIQDARSTIETMQTQAMVVGQAAITASQSMALPNAIADATVQTIAVSKSDFTLPSNLGDIFMGTYSTALTNDRAFFDNLFNTMVNRFYPQATTLATSQEQRMIDILNGTTGLPVAIENAIYYRELDRNNQEANRLMDEATNDWARRGFFLPPGALMDRIQFIQKDMSDKLSVTNRDTAENQAKRAWDATMEVIQLDPRTKMMAALNSYIATEMEINRNALGEATGQIEAIRAFSQASAEYYDAAVKSAQMTLGGREANMNKQLNYERLGNESLRFSYDNQTRTAMAMAQAYARMGSAAAAAQMSLAGVNQNTNLTQ